jgi:hypothetical protein
MNVKVLTNTTAQFRTGSFIVGGSRYAVTQESAAPSPPPASSACTALALTKTSFYSGAFESNWLVAVTAPSSTCGWTAVSDSPWVIVTSDTAIGSGTMRVQVLTNSTGVSRTAHLTVGGVVYKVTQES